ncbi:hypothetical protein GGI05_005226, partial [Coemansia sp. RSA 2603]
MGKKARNAAGRRRNAQSSGPSSSRRRAQQQPSSAETPAAPALPATSTHAELTGMHAWRKTPSSSHRSSLALSSHASSRRRNTANSDDGFTSALSQYMFALDSDALASQYYGNMAHMNELGDRLPRPMNSTLPLFSPSVAHGRRLGRTRSVQGGDVLAGRVRGSAGALQRLEEDACMQDIEAPPSTAAMGHAATFPSAP